MKEVSRCCCSVIDPNAEPSLRAARTAASWGGVMAASTAAPEGFTGCIKRWLLAARIEQVEGPESSEGKQRQQPWWKVQSLTRVSEKAQ